jgi:hypothetical protein
MKRIVTRILEGLVGMVATIIFIHLLCFCLWLIVSFFLWENPIDTLSRGYTKLWAPVINEGWSVLNRITLVLWFGFGLLITGIKIPDKDV